MRALLAVCGLPAALLVCAVWLAFVAGYLGLLAWPFDLFANFRVQYLWLFALCAVALAIARWRRMALVAFVGAAVTTASMAAYFSERPASDPANADFKLVTFNVWFRNDSVERAARVLERSRADVIVLQEVDLTQIDKLAAVLRSYPHHLQTPNVRYGLVVFSRTPLFDVEYYGIPGREMRITRARTRWNGVEIAIIGAHLSWPVSPMPAHQRARELDMIAERVRRETGPVMVAGDFNLTPWSPFFARFEERSRLANCARGHGVTGSWPSQVSLLRIRIDHCFASSHWNVRSVEIGPKLGSDHLPLIVHLELARRANDHSSRTTRLMM